MTPLYHFFVEDITHEKFLKDYISVLYRIDTNQLKFTRTKSWGGIKNQEQPILESFNNNSQLIIVIDTDTSYNERNNKLSSLLEEIKKNLNKEITFHTFLFPNNKDKGNIETLLAQIATDRALIACFEKYETCIASYHKISVKSKIFAYTEAISKGEFTKEKDRNYQNDQHWNLQHEALLPLKSFLKPFFNKN